MQVTSRAITMSSSVASASATSYNVTFTQTSGTVKGVIVDFCSNSPLIGDTCSAPGTFSVGTPTVNYTTGLTAGYTASALNSGRTLSLVKAAGDANVTAVDFTITTVTNPAALGTFYARIFTFPNDTGADSPATYTDTAPGTNYNYGGIALSTANQLVITAKVQESITFCAYTTGSDCSGASGTAIALGDGNGVLANTASTYTNTAKFGLASNAQNGVIVRMKGDTLLSGGNSITSQGSSCTADSSNTTVEQFGLRISTAGAGVTADAPYNCSAGNHALDTANTNTTYGQAIAHTTAGNDESQTTMEFSAKSATSSEAGIYTSTLTFIATGTY